MAYNFKNALVNLNEEIRKSGGGGSDLPAVKLAVSQLQVSMAAVKSSVASVSAQVADIMQTLQNLNPSTSEKEIGVDIDGVTPIYERTWDLSESPVALTNGNWVDVLSGTDIAGLRGYEIWSGEGLMTTGLCEIQVVSGTVKVEMNYNGSRSVWRLTLKYVKAVSNVKKKGGKK